MIVSTKLHRRCSGAPAKGQFTRQPISVRSTEEHVKRIRRRCSVSALLPPAPPHGVSFGVIKFAPRKRVLARRRHRKRDVRWPTRSLLPSRYPFVSHRCFLSRDQCDRPAPTFPDVMFECVYGDFQYAVCMHDY